jgi:hypothetical protein
MEPDWSEQAGAGARAFDRRRTRRSSRPRGAAHRVRSSRRAARRRSRRAWRPGADVARSSSTAGRRPRGARIPDTRARYRWTVRGWTPTTSATDRIDSPACRSATVVATASLEWQFMLNHRHGKARGPRAGGPGPEVLRHRASAGPPRMLAQPYPRLSAHPARRPLMGKRRALGTHGPGAQRRNHRSRIPRSGIDRRNCARLDALSHPPWLGLDPAHSRSECCSQRRRLPPPACRTSGY